MSIHDRRSVRQSFPLYLVGAECSVSAAYQAETSIEGERILVKFDGAGHDGGSLAVKMEPDTALQLYGAIGAELKMRDARLEHRAKIEEEQREAAENCKAVVEGRS